MKQVKKLSNQSAFTLIELLVFVGDSGVVYTIILPGGKAGSNSHPKYASAESVLQLP
jgi:type II secretory pathway pseudopilin PulG